LTLSKAGNITYVLTFSFIRDLGNEVRIKVPELCGDYGNGGSKGRSEILGVNDFKKFIASNSTVLKASRPLLYMNAVEMENRYQSFFYLGENDGPMKDDRGYKREEGDLVKAESDYVVERCLGLVYQEGFETEEVDIWKGDFEKRPNHVSQNYIKDEEGNKLTFNSINTYRGCDVFCYKAGNKKYLLTLNQVIMLSKLCQSRIYRQRKGRFLKKLVLKEISLNEAFKLVLRNKMAKVRSVGQNYKIGEDPIMNFREDVIVTQFRGEEKNTGLPIYLSLSSLLLELYTGKSLALYLTTLIFIVNFFNELFMAIYDPVVEFLILAIKVAVFSFLKLESAQKVLSLAASVSDVWDYCDKINGVKVRDKGMILVNPLGESTFLIKMSDEELLRMSEIRRSSETMTKEYRKGLNFESTSTCQETVFTAKVKGANEIDKASYLTMDPKIELKEPHSIKEVSTSVHWCNGEMRWTRTFNIQNEFLKLFCIKGVKVSREESITFIFEVDINLSDPSYPDFEAYLRKMVVCCVNSEQQIGYIDSRVIHYHKGNSFQISNDPCAYKTECATLPLGDSKVASLCFLFKCVLGPRSDIVSNELGEYILTRFKTKEGADPFEDIKKLYSKMTVGRSRSYGNTDWKKITYFLSKITLEQRGAVIYRVTCPYLSKQDKQDLDRLIKCCNRIDFSKKKGEDLESEINVIKEVANEVETGILEESGNSWANKAVSMGVRGVKEKIFSNLEVIKNMVESPVSVDLVVDQGKIEAAKEAIKNDINLKIEEERRAISTQFKIDTEEPEREEGGEFLVEVSYFQYQRPSITKEINEIYYPVLKERLKGIKNPESRKEEVDQLNKQIRFSENARSLLLGVCKSLKKDKITDVINLMKPDSQKFNKETIDFMAFIAESQIFINSRQKEKDENKYRTRTSSSKVRLGHITKGVDKEKEEPKVRTAQDIVNYCKSNSCNPNSIMESYAREGLLLAERKLERSKELIQEYRSTPAKYISEETVREINSCESYVDIGFKEETRRQYELWKKSNFKSFKVLNDTDEKVWSNVESYSKESIDIVIEAITWLKDLTKKKDEEQAKENVRKSEKRIKELQEKLKSSLIKSSDIFEGNFVSCKTAGCYIESRRAKEGFYRLEKMLSNNEIELMNYYSPLQFLESESLKAEAEFTLKVKETVFELEENVGNLDRSLHPPQKKNQIKGGGRKKSRMIKKNKHYRGNFPMKYAGMNQTKLDNKQIPVTAKRMTVSKAKTVVNLANGLGEPSKVIIKEISEEMSKLKEESTTMIDRLSIIERVDTKIENYILKFSNYNKEYPCFFRWIKKEGKSYKMRMSKMIPWMKWLVENKDDYESLLNEKLAERVAEVKERRREEENRSRILSLREGEREMERIKEKGKGRGSENKWFS
jgi:hypothetical protein